MEAKRYLRKNLPEIMNILIADSGSTKTDWMLVLSDGSTTMHHTAGLNPFIIGTDKIATEIRNHLLPSLGGVEISQLHFYGTGCSSKQNITRVRKALEANFSSTNITVDHDMMGAAKALCGHEPGIACILGTGSNACVYDGTTIVDKLTSPGYLVGDEGSGNHFGKAIIRAYCYRAFPPALEEAFRAKYQKEPFEIIAELYDAPKANAYLATYSQFLSLYPTHPFIKAMVKESFTKFIRRQVLAFPQASSYPIHFTGSIAHFFSKTLAESLQENKLTLGRIIRKPIQGLLEYHTFERP